MSSALLTGVSGLLAHQRWLDVVGHNIANMNTHGFKKSRVLFADMFYETLQPATGPSGDFGGTNPSQIGSGVRIAQVDRNFSQGTLEATGQRENTLAPVRQFMTRDRLQQLLEELQGSISN